MNRAVSAGHSKHSVAIEKLKVKSAKRLPLKANRERRLNHYIEHRVEFGSRLSEDIGSDRENAIKSCCRKFDELAQKHGENLYAYTTEQYIEDRDKDLSLGSIGGYMKILERYIMYLNTYVRTPSIDEINVTTSEEQIFGTRAGSQDVIRTLDAYYINKYGKPNTIRGFSVSVNIPDIEHLYEAELYIKSGELAIICMGSDETEYVRGIGKGLMFHNYGHSAVVAVPIYWEDLIEVFDRTPIGLIHIDTESSVVTTLSTYE